MRFGFLVIVLCSSVFSQAQPKLISHVTADTNFTTRIILANTGAETEEVTLTGYTREGERFEASPTISLSAFAQQQAEATGLFQTAGLSHFFIEASDNVVVSAVYQANRENSGPVHVHQQGTWSKRWRLYAGSASVTWDGFALINGGSETAQVTITQYNAAGDPIGSTSISGGVAPSAKALQVLSSSEPDVFFEIESDQTVALMALRGTHESLFLWENAALPLADRPETGVPVLTHLNTHPMNSGTHRGEILAAEDTVYLVVVEPEGETGPGAPAGGVKHRAYRFDTDLNPMGDSFVVSRIHEVWGEPADHRCALYGDQLVTVYQALNWDENGSGGSGPSEDAAKDQSLILSLFDGSSGTNLLETAIVDRITDFNQDNFPDHCLLVDNDQLLVSTGTRANTMKIREVGLDATIFDTHSYTVSESGVASAIGNSLVRFGGENFLLSATGPESTSQLALLSIGDNFEATQVATFHSDNIERNFPTGALEVDGYLLVGYLGRPRGGNADPESNPYYPYLMVLDDQFQIVSDLQVADAPGFAHVHPTIARSGDRIYLAWSKSIENTGNGPASFPQVQIEVFDLAFQ